MLLIKLNSSYLQNPVFLFDKKSEVQKLCIDIILIVVSPSFRQTSARCISEYLLEKLRLLFIVYVLRFSNPSQFSLSKSILWYSVIYAIWYWCQGLHNLSEFNSIFLCFLTPLVEGWFFGYKMINFWTFFTLVIC